MQQDVSPRTLFQKIWDRHVVARRDDGQTLLYIDRHLVQDGSAPAFEMLRQRQLPVRVPARAFATPDHYVPTHSRDPASIGDAEKRAMATALERDSAEAGIRYFGLQDERQGIVHVVGPEQGLVLPGMVLACGDSHTSTHGALGTIALGIGASEVAHVLATQTLWLYAPRTMRVTIDGRLGPGVTAKDVILAVIAHVGAAGATGHAIEYAGSTIRDLSVEGRMTVCNMSVELGARAGLIAPDEKTVAWLRDRPFAPAGAAWDEAVAGWKQLATDGGARFAREVALDAGAIAPMVTWGNSPEEAIPVTGCLPRLEDAASDAARATMRSALGYMGLDAGQPIAGVPIDHVFIGSCTNGRIEDLRSAAAVVRGRRVAAGVQAWVVPGSGLVKRQAETEGLDQVFTAAGFQWRHAGCSMCLGTNGDQVASGQRCASTSNRNFRGRQGPGSRTHLMSPAMAAAAAIAGRIVDVRTLAAGATP
jgi:3-isopropylmalate/(R)-2-methylmalate dehydratase large subunit